MVEDQRCPPPQSPTKASVPWTDEHTSPGSIEGDTFEFLKLKYHSAVCVCDSGLWVTVSIGK